jgi:dynein heavy chain
MVPTSDTVKYSFLIKNLTNFGFNCLITGETGVGKSVVTRDYLMNTPDTIDHAVVNFSGKTTTKNLMDAFEGKLESRRRDLLGPKPGRKMIFFVDDVNMPQLDAGKAQPPVELLRQVLDHGGFYDTKKLFFKKVADTRFVAACAPPGGGRNEVTPRLFR